MASFAQALEHSLIPAPRGPHSPQIAEPELAPAEESPQGILAAELLRARAAQRSVTVTWLNHHSAMIALSTAAPQLAEIDIVEIDGKFLQRLLGASQRTSADLVLPLMLPQCHNARVALIGGLPEQSEARAAAIQAMLPASSHVAAVIDGYDGVRDRDRLAATLTRLQCDIVLVGMGAGLQEQVGAEIARILPTSLVLTCGGFLDQVTTVNYYPAWAYPLRLNWLVRLVREPRRLWRRYTVDATRAFRVRATLRASINNLPGFRAGNSRASVTPLAPQHV